MKLPAIIISAAVLLIIATPTNASVDNDVNVNSYGSSSSVRVNINNKVNTGSSKKSYSSDQNDTSVYINQEGEGTSSVKINGKEWKLEGPGEINVNNEDTKIVTPEPTEEPEKEPTVTPTEDPSITPEPNEQDTSEPTNIFEVFRQTLREIFSKFKFF